ncbi:MAG: O-antigen ligase family protein [Gracilimonas sp.]|uniref:O-antigen ligase family protein n=1 Tax=Gracilimonas sp. TaxID=1974203 RepID=UPI0019C00307|nr:O-antigen ligase family protein [Gracilimonas sp.]MBD3615425.1 O-antigen ligase family protein [Gracilimonas sp.]
MYRVDYSFFVLIGFVLLFDQFGIPGFEPLTMQVEYFKNFKEISFLPTFNAGVFNAIEVHFILLLIVFMIIQSVKKEFEFNRIAVWGAFLLFIGWLMFSFLLGIKRGGEILTAFWEVRALFYFSILYLVIPQVVQTRKQLEILLWIFIVVISIKAFQGIARFTWLGFSFQGLPALTAHEDPIFMNTLFILLFGFLVYKDRSPHKVALVLLFIPLLAGSFVSQRRAAIAAFAVSSAIFFVLLPGQLKLKFIKVAFPVLISVVLYGAAFWNSNSTIAKPVQMVKSGIEKPDRHENPEDYYSNLFREFENFNLAYTARKNPLFGTGYGRKFEQPLKLAEISFPLKDYIPHNQILWVAAKTGIIGFFLFWFFFNSFALQGAHILQNLRSPFLKAVCTMIVVAIINQMVASFFDLQLTFYRNMIYLGTLMGLLPVLQKIDSEEGEDLEEVQEPPV